MKRKAFIGVLMTVNLLVGSFGGYALWTRRGAPSFSQGGAFGVVEQPAAPVAPSPGAARAGESRVRAQSHTATTRARATVKPGAAARAQTRVNAAGGIRLPQPGTYHFSGTGHEKIELGGGSPCQWDVREVEAVYKLDGNHVIKDVTYSPQRQERVIFDYEPGGVYTSFVGAAVTCLGVRRTTEDTYEPPALRIKLPFAAGETWRLTARTADRTEAIAGEILRRETVTVPAGRFETWKIHLTVEISGGQEGRYETTYWFAPALGVTVKQIERTDVRASGAHFTSDLTLALARRPA